MPSTRLAIAAAAIVSSGAAFAAPPAADIVRVSGASALKANFALALNALCSDANGTLREWTAGGNVSTYVCLSSGSNLTSGTTGTYASAPGSAFVRFAGTAFSEVRLNVAGGSATALEVLAGGADNYLNPGLGTTVVAGGAVNTTAAGGATESSADGIGGFSDVVAEGFPANVRQSIANLEAAIASNTSQPVGVAQSFGVAASAALYSAMFDAQRNPAAGGGATAQFPIPNSCTVADTTRLECVPTIGKGQAAAIFDNNEFSPAKLQGAGYLAPALGTAELRYVRRVDTSGTQATVNNYFLGQGSYISGRQIVSDPSDRTSPAATVASTGCNRNDRRGPAFSNSEVDTVVIASGQIDLCDRLVGRVRVLSAPGTGDVRNELNKSTILGGGANYAIGIMSGENNQASFTNTGGGSTASSWRWLRVQGAPIGENAAPGIGATTNRVPMERGDYDFYYELWAYHKTSSANDDFMTAVIGKLGTLTARGLATVGGTMPFSRGGRTDTPSAGQ